MRAFIMLRAAHAIREILPRSALRKTENRAGSARIEAIVIANVCHETSANIRPKAYANVRREFNVNVRWNDAPKIHDTISRRECW